MKIFLNGEEHELAPTITVSGLLQQSGYLNRNVAIEVNREIVPRSVHTTRVLCAGDRVEIVHALGGG